MRVVIAGSSGLIGSALVSHLRENGHDVVRLVRRTPQAPDERGWDPPAAHLQPGALDGADAVVNLCGAGIAAKRWTGAYKQELRDSRMIPTDLLARAVAEHRVPIMINGSAVGWYGDTGSLPVDESARRGSGFLSDLCRDWEYATTPAADAGARVVLVRTGQVLSPAGGMMGMLRPIFKLGGGGRIGSGQQYMSWISLDDQVGAMGHALESETVAGPMNATGPEPVTNNEFTRALAAQLRRPAALPVPAFALRAALGEFADEGVLVSQRVLPGVLEQDGYTFEHPTIKAAFGAVLER